MSPSLTSLNSRQKSFFFLITPHRHVLAVPAGFPGAQPPRPRADGGTRPEPSGAHSPLPAAGLRPPPDARPRQQPPPQRGPQPPAAPHQGGRQHTERGCSSAVASAPLLPGLCSPLGRTHRGREGSAPASQELPLPFARQQLHPAIIVAEISRGVRGERVLTAPGSCSSTDLPPTPATGDSCREGTTAPAMPSALPAPGRSPPLRCWLSAACWQGAACVPGLLRSLFRYRQRDR